MAERGDLTIAPFCLSDVVTGILFPASVVFSARFLAPRRLLVSSGRACRILRAAAMPWRSGRIFRRRSRLIVFFSRLLTVIALLSRAFIHVSIVLALCHPTNSFQPDCGNRNQRPGAARATTPDYKGNATEASRGSSVSL
jgi:hypothetical protein